MFITSKGTLFSAPAGIACDLKAAGWRYMATRKVWTTTDFKKVLPFVEHCDVQTALMVEKWAEGRQAVIAASAAATSDITIPAPPGLSYRGYQAAGVEFMSKRKVSLNADAPRLGKTIQSLGLVNLYNQPAKVLVICPANAKVNWTREAAKWLVHKGTIGYCDGDNNPETDFLSVNFNILDRHIKAIQQRNWDFIFVDEAHFLGNPQSQRTRHVMSLDASRHFCFLTGTPVFTRPKQLWPMIQRLDPHGLGSSEWRFKNRYCDPQIDPNGRLKFDGFSNEEELQFKMRERFMIRREKSDVVAELPPTRQNVFLPKTGLTRLINKERDLVKANLGDLLDRLQGELSDQEWEALAEFDFRNVDTSSEVAEARRDIALAKIPMVVEFVEELLKTEHKVVVFTHHRDVTFALRDAFAPYKAACVVGGLTTNQRQEAIDRFREDPSCRVFVGNITAAGSAISLAAADVAVFAELSWIPSDIDQAEERIWDVLKTTPLSIYRLVIEDSVESIMAYVLEDRQASIARMTGVKYLKAAGMV